MNKQQAIQLLNLSGTVTQEQIKQAYKKMARLYHPDRNKAGNEMMQMINVAYDLLKDEKEIMAEQNETIADYPAELSEAINAILHTNLKIEICGLWVWVSGNTKEHKELLKESGYQWAPKKQLWYYRPDEQKRKRFSNWSIDKIKDVYGTKNPSQRYSIAHHAF